MQYSSGLVSESFWFVEVKKIISLLTEGKTWDDIKVLCLEQNILGFDKEYRAKRSFGYLKNRIQTIDKDLLSIFTNADLKTQKLINLIAIAQQNQLFFEFLYEVYRDKVILSAKLFTPIDVNIFFSKKQSENSEIAQWTDVTLKRLRSAYLNFLVDAGLLTMIDNQRSITPPILNSCLDDYLRFSNKKDYIAALTGGV